MIVVLIFPGADPTGTAADALLGGDATGNPVIATGEGGSAPGTPGAEFLGVVELETGVEEVGGHGLEIR